MNLRRSPETDFVINKDRAWIDGAPFESNFYHSISLILPEYEKVMIKFCSQTKIPKDGELREIVNRFIRQEDAHRRVHLKYNKALAASGYSIDTMVAISAFNARMIDGYFPLAVKIGVSAAGEHLTHLISQYFMRHYERYKLASDKRILELWHWHIIEEIEHKSDMHDCLQQYSFAFLFRLLSYGLATFWLIFPMTILGTIALSWQDRSLFKWSYWRNMMRCLFGKHGLCYLVVEQSFAYLSYAFHPNNYTDSDRYIVEYDQAQSQIQEAGNRSA